MRRRIPALLALAVVLLAAALAGCGDGGDDTTTSGPGGDRPPASSGDIDAEVIHLAEGVPPFDGPRAVQVYDATDPEGAAALFVDPEAATEDLAGADLDGRTLLGGLVSEGCFQAGDVSVQVVEDSVVFQAEDIDPQEGEVDCARAVVTSALVAVATDDLPEGFDDEPTDTTEVTEPTVAPPPDADEVPSEVVLVEGTRHESDEVAGPGLVRDRVDLEALYGRYGLGEPDPALLGRVEAGRSVLVAGPVSGGCQLPEGGRLVRTGADGLEWAFDVPPEDPDLVCDEAVSALVVVAVDPADVEGVETIDGDPADGPTGVGVVQVVDPVDGEAEPLAARLADVDLAAIPHERDIDLAAPVDGAVRLVFVIEACQPDTAELVADLDAGTVRAEAQQSGPRVDCDALGPHLVIADLAADHADLDPVTD
jgi:hypothetical protein